MAYISEPQARWAVTLLKEVLHVGSIKHGAFKNALDPSLLNAINEVVVDAELVDCLNNPEG